MAQFTLNAAAQAAFEQFATIVAGASVALVDALREAGFETREDAREQAMLWVGAKMGVDVVESKSPFNKGEASFDRTSPKFQAAKTALRRVLDTAFADEAEAGADEAGEANNKAEKFEVPAEIAAIAARLVAACREYDLDAKGLKRLAAQAVAEAFKAK